MTNPEKTSNATFKNMSIGVAEQGGFVIKTFFEKDGASVEQTIVIDSNQADFIRDFITIHMFEVEPAAMPNEPEEAGLYVSQHGHVLKKYCDIWMYADPSLTVSDGEKRWSNGERHTDDWGLVVKDLGVYAFPLKRIDRSDVIALARYRK